MADIPYHEITAADVAELRRLTAPERCFYGDGIGGDYAHDELSGVRHFPDVLLKVHCASEVAAVMKYAVAHHIPVTPRGQGTGLVGGSVALYGGIMLDFTLMNRILELDEVNMTLTVEPGVLLMEVAKYVESRGFFYPPDPGEKTATIGGNINTNAGGMRAVKYGVTRDYVRALEVVLPDGSIMELGGKIVKNSSGYSLKDLMIGSEGTLGVVTRAILRLLPLPRHKVSLLVPFPDLPTAIQTVPRLIGAATTPTAVEFMEREVILASEEFLGRVFPDKSANAYLLLSFDAATPVEIDRACGEAAELCLEAGALDVLIANTEERNESIWMARGAFLEAIKASTTEMDECDVVVPRRHVAEFVIFSHELQARYGVRIRSFGHAGDGNLHIYVLRDELGEAEWKTALTAVFAELYRKADGFGGKVSGEHGIGSAKRDFLSVAISEGERRIMRGIKQAFDPTGILNPGKVVV